LLDKDYLSIIDKDLMLSARSSDVVQDECSEVLFESSFEPNGITLVKRLRKSLTFLDCKWPESVHTFSWGTNLPIHLLQQAALTLNKCKYSLIMTNHSECCTQAIKQGAAA